MLPEDQTGQEEGSAGGVCSVRSELRHIESVVWSSDTFHLLERRSCSRCIGTKELKASWPHAANRTIQSEV